MSNPIGALIVQIASDTSKFVTGVDQINGKIDGFASKAVSLGKMVGIAFGTAEVLSWGKAIIDNAGEISDLSERLEVSTTAVQRWTNAAELGGGTMEDVAKAAGKLNVNLAGGKDSTKDALTAAGLSFDAIRRMRPEEAFEAVAEAVSSIEDPMKRAEVAQALLGKGAQALLPTLGAIKDVSDDGLISEENIKSLDDLGDAFTVVMQKGKSWGAWFAGGLVRDLQTAKGWIDQTVDVLVLGSEKAGQVWADQAAMQAAAARVTQESEQKKREALAKAAEELEKTEKATKRKEAADKAAAQAAEAHTKQIRSLADQLTGKDDIDRAKQMLEALAVAHIDATNVARLSEDQQKNVNKAMAEAIDAYTRGGKVAPEAMRALYVATLPIPPVINGITKEIKDLGTQVEIVLPLLLEAGPNVSKGLLDIGKIGKTVAVPTFAEIQKQIKENTTATVQWDDTLKTIAQSFGTMSQISDGSLGKVTQGIGQSISLASTAKGGFDALKGGLTSLIGGGSAAAGAATGIMGTVASIGMMATGIGALVPVGIAAFKGLKSLFGNDGRKMIEDYAATFVGGFDGKGGLHEALLQAGDAGEAMWKKMGLVGRNNKEQAQAWIQEAQQFLADFHAKEVQAAADAAAAQAKALEDIDGKYADLLKSIDSERQSLMDRIAGEMPEEVMGVIEMQERARLAELDAQRAAIEEQHRMEREAAEASFKVATGKAEDVRNTIQDVFNRGVELPVNYKVNGAPGVPDVPEFEMGSGGLRDFGRGTLALLHNKEAVLTERQYNAMTSGGSPIHIEIHTAATDGATLWRELQTELQRQGHPLA